MFVYTADLISMTRPRSLRSYLVTYSNKSEDFNIFYQHASLMVMTNAIIKIDSATLMGRFVSEWISFL